MRRRLDACSLCGPSHHVGDPPGVAKAHDPAVLAAVIERALTERRWHASYLVRPDRPRMLLDRLSPRTADLVLRLAIIRMGRRRRRAPSGRPSSPEQ